MEATRYVTAQIGTGVSIRLREGFRFRDGREVWRLLCPEEWPYREYVLDLSEVSTITDCGIAWLRFFFGWAEAAQVEVRLINISDALTARLMEAERLFAAGSGSVSASASASASAPGSGSASASASARPDHRDAPASARSNAHDLVEGPAAAQSVSARPDHREAPASARSDAHDLVDGPAAAQQGGYFVAGVSTDAPKVRRDAA